MTISDSSEKKELTISLVGMMGSGKTSVGKILAAKLDRAFVDSDSIIELMAGKPIPDIFNDEGEEYFRALERVAILETLEGPPCILATGGGAVGTPDVLQALIGESIMIWLKASPEDLWQRIRYESHRPLLQTPDPASRLAELSAEREALYRQAAIHIETGEGRQPGDIAGTILKRLSELGNADRLTAL